MEEINIKFFKCRCGCGCKQEHTNSTGSYCRDCEVGDCPSKCARCAKYTTRDAPDGLCGSCAKKPAVAMLKIFAWRCWVNALDANTAYSAQKMKITALKADSEAKKEFRQLFESWWPTVKEIEKTKQFVWRCWVGATESMSEQIAKEHNIPVVKFENSEPWFQEFFKKAFETWCIDQCLETWWVSK